MFGIAVHGDASAAPATTRTPDTLAEARPITPREVAELSAVLAADETHALRLVEIEQRLVKVQGLQSVALVRGESFDEGGARAKLLIVQVTLGFNERLPLNVGTKAPLARGTALGSQFAAFGRTDPEDPARLLTAAGGDPGWIEPFLGGQLLLTEAAVFWWSTGDAAAQAGNGERVFAALSSLVARLREAPHLQKPHWAFRNIKKRWQPWPRFGFPARFSTLFEGHGVRPLRTIDMPAQHPGTTIVGEIIDATGARSHFIDVMVSLQISYSPHLYFTPRPIVAAGGVAEQFTAPAALVGATAAPPRLADLRAEIGALAGAQVFVEAGEVAVTARIDHPPTDGEVSRLQRDTIALVGTMFRLGFFIDDPPTL